MAGRKLTNRHLVFLFAIIFAGLLLLDFLSSIVPSHIVSCLLDAFSVGDAEAKIIWVSAEEPAKQVTA